MIGGFARWIGFFTIASGLVAVLALTYGFFWFAAKISSDDPALDTKADGIVVLTGSASRIPDAVELLAADRGKRLLITGVYRDTSAREIARLTPLYARFFACCVDIDRSALNTFGNALEAKRWAHQHNFNSLIVVTSNWHMPRALVEFSHQLPEVRLVPYSVLPDKGKAEPWWTNSETVRLLIGEYLKYLFALTRMRLDPDSA
jgi:uncharacterized SAM-binding protein YcdF (DUF218 family)